jgi:hypothetical protein
LSTSGYKRCGSEQRVYVSSQRRVAAGDIDAGAAGLGVRFMSWVKSIGMGFALTKINQQAGVNEQPSLRKES